MENSFNKISGLIITYNEEKNIESLLKDMDFCDEIILVDSYSTDKTVEIAKNFHGVKIIKNKFEDFTKQRNLALKEAQNDWVLFLDADERLTPKLKQEIITTTNSKDAKDAYYFYRIFFVGKEKIRFSGTQNDKNFRLFRKSKATYVQEKKVHETLQVNGKTGILKHKLLHYSFENYTTFKGKMLLYSKLKSEELYRKGKRHHFVVQWAKTLFRFFQTYILKLGVLDGKNGLMVSYLQSLYVYKTYDYLKKQPHS